MTSPKLYESRNRPDSTQVLGTDPLGQVQPAERVAGERAVRGEEGKAAPGQDGDAAVHGERRPDPALQPGEDPAGVLLRAGVDGGGAAGTQFNRNIFGLNFGLKSGLRRGSSFDSATCLNYPFLNIFLV